MFSGSIPGYGLFFFLGFFFLGFFFGGFFWGVFFFFLFPFFFLSTIKSLLSQNIES